jgi:diadenosine tetraphosphate (Ap4A) HIT family hydrolase
LLEVTVSKVNGTACEDFCDELTGSQNTSYMRTYSGNPSTRMIHRSRNLALLADLSPLCVGHLLLVSNYHYYSYAEVCRDHLDEVVGVTEQILRLYSTTFGSPLIFEHGSPLNSGGSACISHAHWHFLPISADRVFEVMAKDGLKYTDLNSLSDLTSLADQQVPYFYVGNGEYSRVYNIHRRLPQQYLRSVAGAILGISDPLWDWALVIRKEYLRTTIKATTNWRIGDE